MITIIDWPAIVLLCVVLHGPTSGLSSIVASSHFLHASFASCFSAALSQFVGNRLSRRQIQHFLSINFLISGKQAHTPPAASVGPSAVQQSGALLFTAPAR